MNEYERQRRIAESTKKLYSPGTRIELISMKDPYAPVPAGTRGTVKFVDSMGTIFPEWDNGRSLGVVPSEDSFRKLTQEEIEKYAKQAYEAIYDTGGELYFDDAKKNCTRTVTRFRPSFWRISLSVLLNHRSEKRI